jgi:hypothetical protein
VVGLGEGMIVGEEKKIEPFPFPEELFEPVPFP